MSYVILVDKKYENEDAIENLVNYCSNGKQSNIVASYGVCDNNIHTAIRNMMFVKRINNKMDGKQLVHIVVSIYKYKRIVTKADYTFAREQEVNYARLVSYYASDFIGKLGFQNCVGIHEDTERIHLHMFMNSVNYVDGNRVHNINSIIYGLTNLLRNNFPELDWREPIFK